MKQQNILMNIHTKTDTAMEVETSKAAVTRTRGHGEVVVLMQCTLHSTVTAVVRIIPTYTTKRHVLTGIGMAGKNGVR